MNVTKQQKQTNIERTNLEVINGINVTGCLEWLITDDKNANECKYMQMYVF